MNSTAPICVDLDGTLTKTDTLIESALVLFKKNPLYALWMARWLVGGGVVHLKHEISRRVPLVAGELPYTEDLVAYLQQQHALGRSIWLVTASHKLAAQVIADHFSFITGVIATEHTNLSGEAKAAALVGRFGDRGFVYAGNAGMDLAVWRRAREAIVVNAPGRLEAKARQVATVTHVFGGRSFSWALLGRILRVHQWIKNSLLFVPLVAAHHVLVGADWLAVAVAFVSFSAASSSVYILNDILDLAADRQHPRKRLRPFAAGDILPHQGALLIPILLIISIVAALWLPVSFRVWLFVYLVLTSGYSFLLKREVLVDVVVLALLYTIRIFAGAAAIGVVVTTWLMAFSLFLFMSLALMKRFGELQHVQASNKVRAPGRGYQVGDLIPVGQLGAVSGYLAVLVLALYISSAEVTALYRHPVWLWTLIPLFLYWISRLWVLAHRGHVHDDPLLFAVRDRTSYVVALVVLVVVILAT